MFLKIPLLLQKYKTFLTVDEGIRYKKTRIPANLTIYRVYLGWKVGLEPTTFRTTI